MKRVFAFFLCAVQLFASVIFSVNAEALEDLPKTAPRQTVCYMDFVNGADDNDGLTEGTPIKSYANGAWKKIPNGGTLVVTGKSHIGTSYEFTALGGPLTITSVYGGVDYKDPAPASNPACAWKVEDAKELTFNSDIIFDDIILFQHKGQNTLTFNAGGTLTVTDTVQFMSTGDEHFRIVLNEGATAILSEAAQAAFTIESNGGRVLTYGEVHAHDDRETVLTPATCLPGLSAYICAQCGYSYTAATAPTASHTFGAWTAAEEGYDRTCGVCGTVDHSDFLPGDADGNGKINVRDAALIMQHLADWEVTLTLGAADADGNGEVTLGDALYILKYIAAFDVELCKADTPEEPALPNTDAVADLLSIAQLQQVSENGDHAEDDFRRASLERNYREDLSLNSQTTKQSRYNNGWYPRVKKVRDDLYLLLFMYGQFGAHLYYATSPDGVNWGPVEVLYNGNNYKFVHTDGPLAGTEDAFYAVNADACVLDNGEILCVYSVRPNHGYRTYLSLSGVYLLRGSAAEGSTTIKWSEPTKIYAGINWEPYIMQRDDGQIEVYFSSSSVYASMYGYDAEKRSACAGLLISNDNGYTWSPEMDETGENHFAPYRAYQQYLGDKTITNKEGETLTVPYFGGQMPTAVQLYNGRTMIAIEVENLAKEFSISYATSPVGGDWKHLDLTEAGPETQVTSPFRGAAPYLGRFLSGEVMLNYGLNGTARARMVSPDGTQTDKEFYTVAEARGSWGSCEVVGTHEVINIVQHKSGSQYGFILAHSYLNHRINAPRAAIAVNGYTGDWDAITDALFVGSESQAQFTTRVAHDAENVYFLLSRLDDYLDSDDVTSVSIAAGETASYRIDVDAYGRATLSYYANGACKSTRALDTVGATVLGTVNSNKDTDEGAIYEISVPKEAIGLADGAREIYIRPSLVNVDGLTRTEDAVEGTSAIFTAAWLKVVLE